MKIRKRTSNKAFVYESDHTDFDAAVKEAIKARANFRDAILDGANVYGQNADGLSFINAQLIDANLSKGSARNAEFASAIMNGFVAREAHFDGAKFVKAHLIDAKMSNSFFEGPGTDLSGAWMSGLFDGCHFTDAVMDRIQASGDVTFRGSIFTNVSLLMANFPGTDLAQCKFINCDLRGVNFSGANLYEAEFVDCDISILIVKKEKEDDSDTPEEEIYQTLFSGAMLEKSKGLNPYEVNPLMMLFDQVGQIRAYMLVRQQEENRVEFGRKYKAEGDERFMVSDLVHCFARRTPKVDLFVVRFHAEDIVKVPLSPNGTFYVNSFEFVEQKNWEDFNPLLQ